jgi:hypothetical protein
MTKQYAATMMALKKTLAGNEHLVVTNVDVYLHRLEHNEERLISQGSTGARISATKLVDTIAASHQDYPRGQKEETDENYKSPWQCAQGPDLAAADCIIESEGQEGGQSKDLEG